MDRRTAVLGLVGSALSAGALSAPSMKRVQVDRTDGVGRGPRPAVLSVGSRADACEAPDRVGAGGAVRPPVVLDQSEAAAFFLIPAGCRIRAAIIAGKTQLPLLDPNYGRNRDAGPRVS